MGQKIKSQKVFKVVSSPLSGDLVELCSDRNVLLLFKAKKQPHIASLVRAGDQVTIKDGYVSLYLGENLNERIV